VQEGGQSLDVPVLKSYPAKPAEFAGVRFEAIKAKKATKRELIVVATMISRMIGTPVFSDRTEFSAPQAKKQSILRDVVREIRRPFGSEPNARQARSTYCRYRRHADDNNSDCGHFGSDKPMGRN